MKEYKTAHELITELKASGKWKPHVDEGWYIHHIDDDGAIHWVQPPPFPKELQDYMNSFDGYIPAEGCVPECKHDIVEEISTDQQALENYFRGKWEY